LDFLFVSGGGWRFLTGFNTLEKKSRHSRFRSPHSPGMAVFHDAQDDRTIDDAQDAGF
jgi:hypothetical protein